MYNIWYMDTGRALLYHVSWNVNKWTPTQRNRKDGDNLDNFPFLLQNLLWIPNPLEVLLMSTRFFMEKRSGLSLEALRWGDSNEYPRFYGEL